MKKDWIHKGDMMLASWNGVVAWPTSIMPERNGWMRAQRYLWLTTGPYDDRSFLSFCSRKVQR